MREPDFDWDDETNVVKVTGHGVEPTEAEEAILDPDRVATRAHSTPTERRRGIIGMTEAGRILVVIYTTRQGSIRVVTAYDAPERLKRQYRRMRE
jgi:uncharacterized protein